MRRAPAVGLLILTMALGATPAFAALERVGAVNPAPSVGSYPAWYQDTTGLALEFCDPKNLSEVDGGWCLLLPGDVTVPEVFPTNFFDEHFYFAADAAMDTAGGSRALLVQAVEAAFATGAAAPGQQQVFARIRVRLDEAPVDGTYRFIHPYGEEIFENVVAGERIFFTDDVGINCAPGVFDCALQSRLGPFLLPSDVPGGAEMAALTAANPTPDTDPAHFGGTFNPTPYPGTGKSYIADPARVGPVTGSPLPDFVDSTGATRNHNIFRIEGPPGSGLSVDPVSGASRDWIETTDFSLVGRIFTETIPGRVTVDRATYVKNGTGQKLDVFATGFETTQGRIPPAARPVAIRPQLSFFEAACGVTQGVFSAPPGNLPSTPMASNGDTFWAQSRPATEIPLAVCVRDGASRDANGAVVPTFYERPVSDEIDILEALYDPNAGRLSVKALSSDEITPPTLTLGGFGDLENGQILVSPLAAVPSKIRVLSSFGGANEAQVRTGFFTGSVPAGPTAVNDAFTFAEDAPAQTLAILANDSNVAGGAVTLATQPRLGTAVLNGDGTVTYTPNANANGLDTFTYFVTVGAEVTANASVNITLDAVNDLPIAVNDGTYTVNVNLATVLPNLLANDTDPDGSTDVRNAVNLTLDPTTPGATLSGGANGLVTFTAATAGTYRFTYQAQDASGALSGNVATVTVNVVTSDTVAITSALYRTTAARWVVTGTDSVGNQTITLTYADGPDTTTVIGTATGSATGAWTFDLRGVSGFRNPTTLTPRPTRIRATSSLGGTATATITIRN